MLVGRSISGAAVVVGLTIEDGAEVLEGSVEVVVDEAAVEDEVVGATDVLVVEATDDVVVVKTVDEVVVVG